MHSFFTDIGIYCAFAEKYPVASYIKFGNFV